MTEIAIELDEILSKKESYKSIIFNKPMNERFEQF